MVKAMLNGVNVQNYNYYLHVGTWTTHAKSKEELEYRWLTEDERETQMEDYDSKQNRVRCLIIERLDDRRLKKIDPTLTALQIVNLLDSESNTASSLDLLMKRDTYHDFGFHQGGNFELYLNADKSKAKEYTYAGGVNIGNRPSSPTPINSER